MSSSSAPRTRSRRPVVMAMMLGTALSAMGSECLAGQAKEPGGQAIVDMGRYCTSCWRNARLPADAWGDCTQEVFQRMLERVPPSEWGLVLRDEGSERREFLRAIDAVKKRTQRARRFTPAVDSVPDVRDAASQRLAEEREVVRRVADELLSSRQHRILQLSFEGWGAQEIADELALPVERVSDEKYKAIRKLRAHLVGQEG